MLKRTLTVVALAWLLVSCGGSGEPALPTDLAAGDPLPPLRLETLQGDSFAIESLRGQPVLVSYWATWCQPCLKEIPVLEALETDPRVEVVTIALDAEGGELVEPFATERALPYRILLGDQSAFWRLGGSTIPYSLLVDAEGIVREIFRGPIEAEAVEAALDRVLSVES